MLWPGRRRQPNSKGPLEITMGDTIYPIYITLMAITLSIGCAAREDAANQDRGLQDSGAGVSDRGPGPQGMGQAGSPDPAPPGSQGLQQFDAIMIVKTESQKIAPGETVQLLIQVDRTAPVGDVRLTLRDLPRGVVVVGEDMLLRSDQRVHRLTLRATPSAEGIVDAPVTVVATAEGHPEVAHVFHLTVTGGQTLPRL